MIYKNMEDTRYQFSEELRMKAKKLFEKGAKRKLSMEEVDINMGKISQVMLLYGKVMSRKNEPGKGNDQEL
jgi:hypothetical protein